MMKKYPVIVECTKKQQRENTWAFKRFGLKKAGKKDGIYYFAGHLNEWKYDRLQAHCEKYHIRCKINKSYGKRSADYRKAFFRAYPPHIVNFYFCAYCGKLVHKDKVSVDHLYPLGAVRKNVALQKKLQHKGIADINSPGNLVASCRRCNQRKATKMGKWIIRGKIGRYPSIWVIRHVVRLAIMCVLGYEIYVSGVLQEYARWAQIVLK